MIHYYVPDTWRTKSWVVIQRCARKIPFIITWHYKIERTDHRALASRTSCGRIHIVDNYFALYLRNYSVKHFDKKYKIPFKSVLTSRNVSLTPRSHEISGLHQFYGAKFNSRTYSHPSKSQNAQFKTSGEQINADRYVWMATHKISR